MATTRVTLTPDSAIPAGTGVFPEFKMAMAGIGTSGLCVPSLSYDATTNEAAQWTIPGVLAYGSGPLTFKLRWYADTATAGTVIWEAATAAVTPNADTTTDIETKQFSLSYTGWQGHPGGTGQQLLECIVTGSTADNLVAGDFMAARIRRLGANAADTMAGDAQLVGILLEYSDV